MLDRIPLDQFGFACALDGNDGRTLFMLTAYWHMDEDFMDNLQRLTTGSAHRIRADRNCLSAQRRLAEPLLRTATCCKGQSGTSSIQLRTSSAVIVSERAGCLVERWSSTSATTSSSLSARTTMPHSHLICLIMKAPFAKYPTGSAPIPEAGNA